jgi:hypothetical protein
VRRHWLDTTRVELRHGARTFPADQFVRHCAPDGGNPDPDTESNDMKHLAPVCALVLAGLPLSAAAVLLDCQINDQRIYTCVEVGVPGAETQPVEQVDSEAYGPYLEQAQQQCVYREPRRRTGGKKTSLAARTEQLKSAREDYEACVSATARELWLKDNPPGSHDE